MAELTFIMSAPFFHSLMFLVTRGADDRPSQNNDILFHGEFACFAFPPKRVASWLSGDTSIACGFSGLSGNLLLAAYCLGALSVALALFLGAIFCGYPSFLSFGHWRLATGGA